MERMRTWVKSRGWRRGGGGGQETRPKWGDTKWIVFGQMQAKHQRQAASTMTATAMLAMQAIRLPVLAAVIPAYPMPGSTSWHAVMT